MNKLGRFIKWVKIIALIMLLLIFVNILLFSFALICTPFGNIFFSLCFGKHYFREVETEIYIGDQFKVVSIYKARNKPFLLLGPIILDDGDDNEDFIFVNKQQVIRTSTDKCGKAWTCIFNILFVLDDLTNRWDQMRAPIWDAVESDPSGAISFDLEKQKYIYKFRVDSLQKPIFFEIPARLLTEDMETAPNITLL